MKPTDRQLEAMKLLGISEQEWQFTTGRYLEARDELAKLRVSLARIAQAAGLDKLIPGGPYRAGIDGDASFAEAADDALNFQALHHRAVTIERGWNALAADIVDNICNMISDAGHNGVSFEPLVKPTVHLNGTSREALLDGYAHAIDALHEAGRKLAAAYPNGRDYYVQGEGAISIAMQQHEARVTKLRDIANELEQIAGDL